MVCGNAKPPRLHRTHEQQTQLLDRRQCAGFILHFLSYVTDTNTCAGRSMGRCTGTNTIRDQHDTPLRGPLHGWNVDVCAAPARTPNCTLAGRPAGSQQRGRRLTCPVPRLSPQRWSPPTDRVTPPRARDPRLPALPGDWASARRSSGTPQRIARRGLAAARSASGSSAGMTSRR